MNKIYKGAIFKVSNLNILEIILNFINHFRPDIEYLIIF